MKSIRVTSLDNYLILFLYNVKKRFLYLILKNQQSLYLNPKKVHKKYTEIKYYKQIFYNAMLHKRNVKHMYDCHGYGSFYS